MSPRGYYVERNYAIAIATLGDLFKNLAPV